MDTNFSEIQAIFFDTSDTLYRNAELEKAYPARLVDMIAEGKGLSTEEAKQLLNDTTEKLKTTEKHVTKIRAAEKLGFTRDDVWNKAFGRIIPADYLATDEALSAVMATLAQRYSLGIISNLKQSHVIGVIKALGLSPDSFRYFVTLDIVQEIKPAAEPFLKAIELAGCNADECLYIGDSPSKDMRPAKEVGMKTILVSESPSPEDMEHAYTSIEDVKEIVNLLGIVSE
jgi:HAD superfamily hydrolase (TIGR01549 family)